MNNTASEFIVEIRNVVRSYPVGDGILPVLRGVNWNVRRGSSSCLVGASGSGKTTLLNLIGALEKPDEGTILVDGVDPTGLSRRECAIFRRRKIGFVFQAYHLFPELSVLENVVLPATLNGTSRRAATAEAETLLDRVGLKDRLKHRPTELSGGEQQRAAIARALINHPPLLLADEPTGNLDSKTGAGILELFARLREENPEQTILMITHNREIARAADDAVELADGILV